MGLVDNVLDGSQRALARLATHVENDDGVGREGLVRLYPHTGKAHVVGVTGPPGAGKSTLIGALIGELRGRGLKVGVVAVDPSSQLTGGATLGDRIRMLEWQSDAGVFIRSMASRGRAGGLAPATAGMVHLLDAAGFEVIVVETVGVGQEEIDVSRLVDTLVLVQVPGSGDGVQLLKAGLLEFADIFVVNKADLAGAEELLRGLRSMVGFSAHQRPDWAPPVLRCTATDGVGLDKLANAIVAHGDFLRDSGRLHDRRCAIARAEIADYVNAVIRQRLSAPGAGSAGVEAMVEDVARRRLAPLTAAHTLLENWEDPGQRNDQSG
ncbi:MAG: GTPase [Thermomicrobiales bacterium]|nr:GTPase [Thermomicrobiales bacterium]